MSRTEELRRGSGTERGSSGGGAPFVKWGDDYCWLEGQVTGSFSTKYGLAVTLKVSAVSDGGLMAQGRNEDGDIYTENVASGMEVNVGTQSAALAGKIVPEDVGKNFHIAFEGWEQGKQNKYRVFAVIHMAERDEQPVAAGHHDNPDPIDTTDYSEPSDDGLPF